jgi:hypothetical protein
MEGQTDIWSTTLDLFAYCDKADADHALANVNVLGGTLCRRS